jgi:ABC-type glycerol-3-phosphate transport system substrate-binding protein
VNRLNVKSGFLNIPDYRVGDPPKGVAELIDYGLITEGADSPAIDFGSITDPATVEAIEFYAGLTTDGVSPQSYVGENELVPLGDMANGQVGMYIDGGWAMGAMEEQAEDPALLENVVAAPIPGADGIAPVFAGGSALSVFATTQQPDLAFELLTVMGDEEGGKGYADVAGFFPAYPALLDSDEYHGTIVSSTADPGSYPVRDDQ